MDARIMKLSHRLAVNLARVLVNAGFDTPRRIKGAEDADLLAVLKRPSALADVRAVFPKV